LSSFVHNCVETKTATHFYKETETEVTYNVNVVDSSASVFLSSSEKNYL
jgi:hypothetical protein